MSVSALNVKRPPEEWQAQWQRQWPTLRRWLWRLIIAAIILSLIGYFSSPSVSPLMCKIYG